MGSDIRATVETVRAWNASDGSLPPEEGHEKWITGGSVSVRVKRFLPQENMESEHAQGQFLEIIVWLENTGTKKTSLPLDKPDDQVFDASLVSAGSGPLAVKAMWLPGANVSSVSRIISFKGKLGMELAPGEKTWVLLLFDVPKDWREGKLNFKNRTGIEIQL